MPFNPFATWPITGTWADHMSYSLGGEDYPLPYNTPLPMPAAGVLYTSGRPRGGAEFQCGLVGSAGRRQILMLTTPIRDVVAVVFQHLSVFGAPGRLYREGETGGRAGASTVVNGVVKERGGDVHLHIHCLTADGQRRKFTDYFGGVTAASSTQLTPIEEDDMYTDQDRLRDQQAAADAAFAAQQMQGKVYDDRDEEFQLSTAIRRIREILHAVSGTADPALVWDDGPLKGQPVTRALARFLQNPSGVSAESILAQVKAAVKDGLREGSDIEGAVDRAFSKVFRGFPDES